MGGPKKYNILQTIDMKNMDIINIEMILILYFN